MTAADETTRPPAARRVLFVDHTAELGGGEIALLHLVRHLDRARYEPVVLLLADGPLRPRLADAGVEVHVRPVGGVGRLRKDGLGVGAAFRLLTVARALAAVGRLRRDVRRLDVAVVHTNSLKADVIGGLAGRWAGRPVVWHVRDRIDADYLPAAAVRVFRWLCRRVPTGVIANSAATMATIGLPPAVPARRVVHDGLPDVPGGDPPPPPGKCRVGLVGRIARWKGQHVFLDAASSVRTRFPEARFRIVGSALFGEEAYAAELRAQLGRLGLADAVEFTGFRPDVDAVMADLDVVVHASVTAEPFGQVVIEAMAAGRPVVATDGGGPREIVVDGGTGLLVPMADATAMAAAICQLLADPVAAAAMGRSGRRHVRERFTIERTAAGVQGFYDEVLGGGRAGGAA